MKDFHQMDACSRFEVAYEAAHEWDTLYPYYGPEPEPSFYLEEDQPDPGLGFFSVDLRRPLATKDKRREAPSTCDVPDSWRQPVQERELVGGWFSREVEPKDKKGKPDSFRLTGKNSGGKDVWFSHEGKRKPAKLFGVFEVGKTLREFLLGNIDTTNSQDLVSWHETGLPAFRYNLSFLPGLEYSLGHTLAKAFSEYKRVADKQCAAFFGEKEQARLVRQAELELDKVRADILEALVGKDKEYLPDPDEGKLDSRMKSPRESLSREYPLLWGDMERSGFEGADWLDKLLYGSVNYKIKGSIAETRIGVFGTLHPASFRNGKSLLREYDDTVGRCKTSILSGGSRAMVEDSFRQRVRSLCSGFVSTADPFDRAELVTRYCEAKRKQKRPRFAFSMFVEGHEKVEDGWKPVVVAKEPKEYGFLLDTLRKELESRAELQYKTKRDTEYADALPSTFDVDVVEHELVDTLAERVREKWEAEDK